MSDDGMGNTVVLLGALAIGGYFLIKYLPSIVGSATKGAVDVVTSTPGNVAAGVVSGVSSGVGNVLTEVAKAQGYTPTQSKQLAAAAIKVVSNPTLLWSAPRRPAVAPAVHEVAGKIVGASTSVNPSYQTGLTVKKLYGMGR